MLQKLFFTAMIFVSANGYAGSRGDLPLAFLTFDGIHATAEGRVYAADGFDGSKIYEISSQGEVTVLAEGLSGPIDITQTSDGSLFVTNFFTANVSRISPDGVVSDFAQVLEGPSGITSDSQDNLYVSHFGIGNTGDGDTVLKITPEGVVSEFSKGGLLRVPIGIVVDEYDMVYVANLSDGVIMSIDNNGIQQEIAQIESPSAFSIGHLAYAKGKLYATNLAEGRIFSIKKNGRVRQLKASKKVEFPNGVTFNPATASIMVLEAFKPVSKVVNIRIR